LVPLALGLVVFAGDFSVFNAGILFLRIRLEAVALGLASGRPGRLEGAETVRSH
jgi:hypothetical protein